LFKNGSRVGQIKLEQLIAKTSDSILMERTIFVHDQTENKFHYKNEIIWHGKNPPSDQTIRVHLLYKIPTSLFVFTALQASVGILVAFAFLIFNIKFRKHR
jgi:hypothetical protein